MFGPVGREHVLEQSALDVGLDREYQLAAGPLLGSWAGIGSLRLAAWLGPERRTAVAATSASD